MTVPDIALRAITDADIALITDWLARDHVRPWFTEPDDWLHELRERRGKYSFITHFITLAPEEPFAFCQYYPCAAAKEMEDDFAAYDQIGLYSVDYLIGEPAYLGKGYGTAIVRALLERIFALPGARMAVAKPDAENAASRATLESCGFSLDPATGVHRISREDFAS